MTDTKLRPEDLTAILNEVGAEVQRAMSKHADFNSPHEGWAALYEEVDELWEEVKKKKGGRDASARMEAIQCAAMGVRYVLNLCDNSALSTPAPEKAAKVSAFPVGNCVVCGELVAPYNKHAKYEGGYTCQPAPPAPAAPVVVEPTDRPMDFNRSPFAPAAPEMPEAVKWAIYQLRQNVRLWEIHGEQPASETDRKTADALESWWRNLTQPVAVGMTEELERVLDYARKYGLSVENGAGYKIAGEAAAQPIYDAIAAVRQQAAQGRKVELGKVRELIEWEVKNNGSGLWAAALAELDAAEGKGANT